MRNQVFIFILFLLFNNSSLFADPNDGVLDVYAEIAEIDDSVSELCLSVTTDDFESVSLIQIPVQWDPTKLVYKNIENEAFPGSITVPDQENGTLRYIAQDATLSNPLNLEDGAVIFDICFDIIFHTCEKTDVTLENIVDVPPPFPFEAIDDEGEAISTMITNGSIEIICQPLSICLDAEEYIVGENNCLSIFTSQFSKIQTFQFSLDYNTTELEFTNLKSLNSTLPITNNHFSEPDLGSIRVGWFDLSGLGIDLEDCDVIAELCFDVLSTPSSTTPVTIGANIPGGMEATDVNNNLLVLDDNCSCMVVHNVDYTFEDLELKPNPVLNNFWVEMGDFEPGALIQVVDLHGTLVYEESYSMGDSVVSIETSNFSQGMYLVKVSSKHKVAISRFLKI